MGVPPGNRPAVPRDWFRGVPERYVAGGDTRGRQAGRPYSWSQQVIHDISGLDCRWEFGHGAACMLPHSEAEEYQLVGFTGLKWKFQE